VTPEQLKQVLCEAAFRYAQDRNLVIDVRVTAVLFTRLADAFHPTAYEQIQANPLWAARAQQPHQNVPGYKEMQSSNSSDALLMNIFCHPQIFTWQGVRDLLEIPLDNPEINPEFGFPAGVQLENQNEDGTEIDMSYSDLFVEAKLTESDFTHREARIVENYTNLQNVFHVEALPRIGDEYDNYQIIRNLLAAIQHGKRHILICDERRLDLMRRYFETVSCLRDVAFRCKCRVVFWQEIAARCGNDLRLFLEEKYGMCQP
jgi:hypothetical protein